MILLTQETNPVIESNHDGVEEMSRGQIIESVRSTLSISFFLFGSMKQN